MVWWLIFSYSYSWRINIDKYSRKVDIFHAFKGLVYLQKDVIMIRLYILQLCIWFIQILSLFLHCQKRYAAFVNMGIQFCISVLIVIIGSDLRMRPQWQRLHITAAWHDKVPSALKGQKNPDYSIFYQQWWRCDISKTFSSETLQHTHKNLMVKIVFLLYTI